MNDIAEILVLVAVGFVLGMLCALGLCNIESSKYVDKDKLRNKQTISMSTYYAQYSAVRRFPK